MTGHKCITLTPVCLHCFRRWATQAYPTSPTSLQHDQRGLLYTWGSWNVCALLEVWGHSFSFPSCRNGAPWTCTCQITGASLCCPGSVELVEGSSGILGGDGKGCYVLQSLISCVKQPFICRAIRGYFQLCSSSS